VISSSYCHSASSRGKGRRYFFLNQYLHAKVRLLFFPALLFLILLCLLRSARRTGDFLVPTSFNGRFLFFYVPLLRQVSPITLGHMLDVELHVFSFHNIGAFEIGPPKATV